MYVFKKIIIPSSVCEIDALAFDNTIEKFIVDAQNTRYVAIENVLYERLDSDKLKILNHPDSKEVETLTLPENVVEIADAAFENNKKLRSIDIPDSVTKIGWGAFNGCRSLESIDIPGSVTKIERSAFSECENLEEIHCRREEDIQSMKIDSEAFDESIFKEGTLFVPSGTRWEYRHHPVWGRFQNIETEKVD